MQNKLIAILAGLSLVPTVALLRPTAAQADGTTVYAEDVTVVETQASASHTTRSHSIDASNLYVNQRVTTRYRNSVVNMRSGPGLNYPVVAQTKQGNTHLSDARVMEAEGKYHWHRVIGVDGSNRLQYMWIREDLLRQF